MATQPKVFIIDGNFAYANLFRVAGFIVCPIISEADLICFTGGEDVSPSLYGDKQHKWTSNCLTRDKKEKELYDLFVGKTPMVGICRGAQFLNVMNGGRMYQDVEGHRGSHIIIDNESGNPYFVTSTHHQMMMPHAKGVVLAEGREKKRREWFDGDVEKCDTSDRDYEVVFYPDTKSLCFQPHPEMGEHDKRYTPMREYFIELVDRKLMS